MNRAQIETALNRAIDKFVECDKHLLAADANERSMTHRIAVYLEHEMPGYNVDCEYNRDGFDVKRLELAQRLTSTDNDEAVTVFPDIIVHRRGNNDHNLLVVERKKAAAGSDIAYDLHKLRAFRRELKYTRAVHLIIGRSRNGNLVRRTQWFGIFISAFEDVQFRKPAWPKWGFTETGMSRGKKMPYSVMPHEFCWWDPLPNHSLQGTLLASRP